ncbi:MAG: hypothetical protein JEZ09_05975 [Salinivirgaceae bacterium]|nr:hypothetical protein [Salinivirgaceae bacterium]
MKLGFAIIFSLFLFWNKTNAQDFNLQNDSAIQHINTSDFVTKIDSLNFAFEGSYGDSIRRCYFNNDSTDKSFYSFIYAFDEVFAQEDWLRLGLDIGSETDQAKMYKKGVTVGDFIIKQNSKGVMEDSTITFNQKLVETGFIDALNKSFNFMNPQKARQFITRKINISKNYSQPELECLITLMV